MLEGVNAFSNNGSKTFAEKSVSQWLEEKLLANDGYGAIVKTCARTGMPLSALKRLIKSEHFDKTAYSCYGEVVKAKPCAVLVMGGWNDLQRAFAKGKSEEEAISIMIAANLAVLNEIRRHDPIIPIINVCQHSLLANSTDPQFSKNCADFSPIKNWLSKMETAKEELATQHSKVYHISMASLVTDGTDTVHADTAVNRQIANKIYQLLKNKRIVN